MSDNVFGEPITEATLRGMSQYTGKMITRRNMAQVALDRQNAEGKNVNARLYAEGLKKKWGRGTATMCLIYNATGGTITLVQHHDWFGHVAAVPYPADLANGQWGVFLHVRPTLLPQGSAGAVMYQGRNGDGLSCDWIMAWHTPWNRPSHDNQVAAYIREGTPNPCWHMDVSSRKPGVHDSYSDKGCRSSVATSKDKRPLVKAIFTLENLQLPTLK